MDKKLFQKKLWAVLGICLLLAMLMALSLAACNAQTPDGPTAEHVHEWFSVVTPPSGTEKGYTTHSCSCGATYTDSETADLGHSWKDATCTAPKTCTVCSATKGSPNGHSYNRIVTDPTETKQGYTTHICTVCGHSYKDKYTAPVEAHEAGTLVLSASGVARLYGENNQVVNAYPGWLNEYYYFRNDVPWYAQRAQITKVIIKNGTSPRSTANWFYDYTNLISAIIGSGTTSIDYYAFHGCTSLTNVTIPDSVTNIGEGAFRKCVRLTNVAIPDSVTSIGDGAFFGCSSLTNITIPDSMTRIGNYTFKDCTSMTSITIPDSVTSIGFHAFQGCTSLTSLAIPDSVTNIDGSAFFGCSSLTSITISDSVTNIGHYAFQGCTSLTNIEFNGTIAEWNAIAKGDRWAADVPAAYVQCTDGKTSL